MLSFIAKLGNRTNKNISKQSCILSYRSASSSSSSSSSPSSSSPSSSSSTLSKPFSSNTKIAQTSVSSTNTVLVFDEKQLDNVTVDTSIAATKFIQQNKTGYDRKNHSAKTNAATLDSLLKDVHNNQKHSNITTEKVHIPPMNLVGPRAKEWYTGKTPQECAGISDNIMYSLKQVSLDSKHCSKIALQNYFDNTWALTEVLFACLQGEEAFMRSPYHDLRHPLIFYYGHPATLYVNKLRVAGLVTEPINPYYETIFETGVDEMSWDDLSKNKMPWPSVASVHEYRKKVYQLVTNLISNLDDELLADGIKQDNPLWALVMSFEHERIHLETSSVLITELPVKYVRFPEHFPPYHTSVNTNKAATSSSPRVGIDYPQNEMVNVKSKSVTIGKSRDAPSFGWDNEYGHRTYQVPEFNASKFKISNGEFHEFVKDGGYSRVELWSSLGWEWRAFRNAKWPSFWLRSGPQGLQTYELRLLFDETSMQWSLPVCVNYHEAHAFATWKSLKTNKTYRLLTELEHKAIRDDRNTDNDHILDSTNDTNAIRLSEAKANPMNLNLSYSSMSAVDYHPANDSGFHDVFGNAWEWTMDYFSALPGFKVHAYYEDFSTPCFDGLHHVIQGGSFISTGNEGSIYSRFHFRPHFFQHSTFRLVEQVNTTDAPLTSDTDAPGPYVGSYPFRRSLLGRDANDNDKKTRQKTEEWNNDLSKHYLHTNESIIKSITANNYTDILSNILFNTMKQINIDVPSANVLEVGCGLGNLSLLVAQHAKLVIGIDHSNDKVVFAKKSAKGSVITIPLQGEGNEVISYQDNSNIVGSVEAEFRCADPMCLPAEMKHFEVVIINDVIDKMASPNSLLGRVGGERGLVAKKGLLMFVSAFQWNHDTTPESLWLGGYVDKDINNIVRSETTLIDRLSDEFSLISNQQVPIVWQESTRDLRGKVYSILTFQRR